MNGDLDLAGFAPLDILHNPSGVYYPIYPCQAHYIITICRSVNILLDLLENNCEKYMHKVCQSQSMIVL